jgi:predicted MPP superfamily phosphohydrolase
VGFTAGDGNPGKSLRAIGSAWVITLPYWLIALILNEGIEFAARGWRKRHAGTPVKSPALKLQSASNPKSHQKWRRFLKSRHLVTLFSRPCRNFKAGAAADDRFENKDEVQVPPDVATSGGQAGRTILRRRLYWCGVPLAVAIILFLGNRNFHHPVLSTAEFDIKKTCAGREHLQIALASDLHLGEVIGRAELKKYVDALNALNADLILLAGDLVDNRPEILSKEDMGEELRRLKAPLGVFAVLGNHDVFSDGGTECAAYFTQNGVRVLRDEVVTLDNGAILLAGRRDKAEGKELRKPLKDVLRGADSQKPLLVLDHQPQNSHLREGAQNGADLYLCGHTHGGQVWPVTWLLSRLYKVFHGSGREGAMNIHVTSGLGLWGFPARIGSNSEIVIITLRFPQK